MIKSVFTKNKLDTSKYVNFETGELLSSESPNITSVNKHNDLVIVSSTEYVVIDSQAKAFIEGIFNQAECGRIFKMADMVKGNYNILFDKKTNQPHDLDSLQTELDYTRNIFSLFMKKLFDKSIIAYIDSTKNRKRCRVIMMNPTFARKSKVFTRDCLAYFDDLSKK